jgi:photosystem II stability/assembly factor-like uncharacterized protein
MRRVLAAAAALIIVLLAAACTGQPEQVSSASSRAPSASPLPEPQSKFIKEYFDTDVWQAVPMVNARMVSDGYTGGEGGQWPSWITFDPVDGNLAFMGTDTGGVFRSQDGGKTWSPSTLGLDTRGAVCINVDPNNTDRVALIGSVGTTSGVFMSYDGGESWARKLKSNLILSHDYRNQIVFDESSYDKSIGGSKVLYWLRYTLVDDHCLYKSQDGGESWQLIEGIKNFTAGWMEIDLKGNLYIGHNDGLYKSTDGGKSWSQVLDKAVNSLCIIRTKGYENYVYALTNRGLYLSKNSGADFALVTEDMPAAVIKNYTFLEVSPVNPNKMVMQNDTLTKAGDYSLPSYYSTDGGKTWTESTFDTTTNVWSPFNYRQRPASFHPTREKVVITIGGDSIYRSQDGGATYTISSEGYNGIYVASKVFFNVNNPNLVAAAAQDHSGGYSTDGGKTWRYVNWSGKGWGGHAYGTYALSEYVVIAGASDKWRSNKDAVQRIAVTYNGGLSVARTDYIIEGSLVACGAKGDENVAFIGEWRTADGAKTFQKMNGCTGVMAIDLDSGRLFGVNGFDIVTSTDNGVSWTKLYRAEAAVNSMAYNSKQNCLYYNHYTAGLMRINLSDDMQSASAGGVLLSYATHVCCVDVDPRNTDIVYAVCHNDDNYDMQNVYRSLDGGKTWTGLGRQVGDGRSGPDGANQSMWCTVNPATGELYVFTHCNGVWKISGPPEQYYK